MGFWSRYPLATFRSREAKYVMVAWKPLLWRPTPFLLVSRTATATATTAVVIPEIFKLLGAKWKVNSKYRKHCLHTCQPKLIFKQEKNKLKNFFFPNSFSFQLFRNQIVHMLHENVSLLDNIQSIQSSGNLFTYKMA